MEVLPAAQRTLWPTLAAARRCGFVLYGGTALSLRLGHRVSEDFDFFSSAKINRSRLYALMPFLSNSTIAQDEPRTLTVLAPSEGDAVKVSFFGEIKFGCVEEPQLTDDHVCEIASEIDLLGTKLKVLLERIETKDYRDIAALLRHGVALEKGLGAARALYGKAFAPTAALKALTYFDSPELSPLEQQDREYLIDRVTNVQKLESVRIVSPSLSLDSCRQSGYE
ncbi:MAG: nucleotidyl transferase AbiEii/AbiGii toxin family protein [Vulcanimicrobiaceae bacterium]